MAFLIAVPVRAPEPLLSSLVAGFALLVIGLAVLTVRKHRDPLASPRATRRALFYALVYGLCYASFARVIGTAILGYDRSPWLLALGDVIFVTVGLYVWVMVLAEGYALRDFGFRRVAAGRLALMTFMGLGAVAVYALLPYWDLLSGRLVVDADTLVFAALLASVGSALPDEVLFRGYLMGSLNGRARLWARVAMPALAFTVVRGMRAAPGLGLGSAAWMLYLLGVALPLGLWWGLMRELSGGSIWPGLISHCLLEFGGAIAAPSPEST